MPPRAAETFAERFKTKSVKDTSVRGGHTLRHVGEGAPARVEGARGVGALGDAGVEEEGMKKRGEECEATNEDDDDAGVGDIIGLDAGWRRREGQRA